MNKWILKTALGNSLLKKMKKGKKDQITNTQNNRNES